MSKEHTPSTRGVRSAYLRVWNGSIKGANAETVAAEFDRWLDQVKDEARREALRSAASEVRREARWQEEQLALHESRSSVVRLLMLEQIFIDWSNQEEV